MSGEKKIKFKNDFIEEYCGIHAESEIFERGVDYFKRGKVIAEWFAPNKKNIAIVSVRGNGAVYDVHVRDYDNEGITTHCNCPYSYGGICKHEVAALIKLDKIGEEQEKEKEIEPNPVTDENCTIWELNKLSEDYLNAYTEQQLYSSRDFMDYEVEVSTLNDSDLQCHVSPGYSFYNEKKQRVDISKHKLGIQLVCSCNGYNKNVCKHKLAALKFLVNEEYFPNIIFPEKKKRLVTKILDSYGVTGKVAAEDFLKFQVSAEGRIELKINEKYSGLQPVKPRSRSVHRATFLTKTLAQGFSQIDLPEVPIEDENQAKFSLGFVFSFNPYSDKLAIDPIVGKLNKAGTNMISNFQYYDELVSVPVTEETKDERLLMHCQKITNEKIDRYLFQKNVSNVDNVGSEYSFELIQYLMKHLPSIFSQLKEQPYVFTMRKDGYGSSIKGPKRTDLIAVNVSPIPANLIYRITEDDICVDLIPVFEIDGEEYSFDNSNIEIINSIVIKLGDTLHLMNGLQHALAVKNSFESESIKMVSDHASIFLDEYVVPLSSSFEIKIDQLSGYEMQDLKVKPVKKKLYITGNGHFVLFKPVIEYDNGIDVEVLKNGSPLTINGHIIHKTLRDYNFESEFKAFLRGLHASFERQNPQEFFTLKVEQMIDKFWFFDAFDKLKQAEVEVYGLKELKNFRYNPHKGSVTTTVSSGKDWFEAEVQIAFGDTKVTLAEIKKALLKNEKYIKLSDNSIGIMPEEWLAKFNRYLRVGEVEGDKLLISKKKFPVVEELFENIDNTALLEELAEKRRLLKAFEEIKDVEVPQGITANLRDYQKAGYNWMCFLHSFKWGGILADDMGLGKTVQAITFLKKVADESDKPSLIVVPTTLIFNWESELNKFCPSLNAHFHYGINRVKSVKKIEEQQIVITTYGMIVNDIEFLRKIDFNYIILDESQAIKNPSSKRFKAATLLRADNRIAMTGTPIENNTFDLYAQMSFVNPGFLGSASKFRDQFSTPIDKEGNRMIADELQQLIAPFVIRRTKEQVATELPPKTEDVILCSMDDEQRKVYDAYRNKIRNQLMEKIESEGLGKSKIHVLEGLMKLRQICDSPALLSDEENYGTDSVKIKELMRHITRKTANHKIVIFSQFVKMLALLKEEVQHLNIDFEYLDGQCSQAQRKESVDRFQTNDDCRLFLISLKAGGTGINLTAADYVYIVDPWWNPAVENQAIDRCYRIGQDKKVFAYRMICKDTIEEKIIAYQRDKKAVADGIIQTDESFMKQLTQDDVSAIFG